MFSFFHQPIKHSCSGLAMPTALLPQDHSSLIPCRKLKEQVCRSMECTGSSCPFISLLSSTSWLLLKPLPLLHLCLDRSHAPPPSRAQLPQFPLCLMSVRLQSSIQPAHDPSAHGELPFQNENISKLGAFFHMYLITSEQLYVFSKCSCQTVRSLINIMLTVALLYQQPQVLGAS